MTAVQKLQKKFLSALRRGTGEGHLLLQAHPEIDFSQALILGMQHCDAYDGQCEGSRVPYLLELMSLCREQEKIREGILEGLAAKHESTWTLLQLFDLAYQLALKGDSEAHKAIYNRFLNPVWERGPWVGARQIMELDKTPGLLFVARQTGKWLRENSEEWQDGDFLDDFQDIYPHLDGKKILEVAAEEDPFIKVYLDRIAECEAEEASSDEEENPVFQNITAEILASGPSFRRRSRIRKLEQQEVLTLADALVRQTKPKAITRLLSVFDSHPFPGDPDFIFRLANPKGTFNNSVRKAALSALGQLTGKSIRNLALQNILSAKDPALFTDLLILNYQVGDAGLLTKVAHKHDSKHTVENLLVSYLKIFKKNPVPACQEPLEVLYRKSNCGIHRRNLVELLLHNNVLSEEIRREIPYDSDEETRDLLAGKQQIPA